MPRTQLELEKQIMAVYMRLGELHYRMRTMGEIAVIKDEYAKLDQAVIEYKAIQQAPVPVPAPVDATSEEKHPNKA